MSGSLVQGPPRLESASTHEHREPHTSQHKKRVRALSSAFFLLGVTRFLPPCATYCHQQQPPLTHQGQEDPQAWERRHFPSTAESDPASQRDQFHRPWEGRQLPMAWATSPFTLGCHLAGLQEGYRWGLEEARI